MTMAVSSEMWESNSEGWGQYMHPKRTVTFKILTVKEYVASVSTVDI
jgi:hypothetical protein